MQQCRIGHRGHYQALCMAQIERMTAEAWRNLAIICNPVKK